MESRALLTHVLIEDAVACTSTLEPGFKAALSRQLASRVHFVCMGAFALLEMAFRVVWTGTGILLNVLSLGQIGKILPIFQGDTLALQATKILALFFYILATPLAIVAPNWMGKKLCVIQEALESILDAEETPFDIEPSADEWSSDSISSLESPRLMQTLINNNQAVCINGTINQFEAGGYTACTAIATTFLAELFQVKDSQDLNPEFIDHAVKKGSWLFTNVVLKRKQDAIRINKEKSLEDLKNSIQCVLNTKEENLKDSILEKSLKKTLRGVKKRSTSENYEDKKKQAIEKWEKRQLNKGIQEIEKTWAEEDDFFSNHSDIIDDYKDIMCLGTHSIPTTYIANHELYYTQIINTMEQERNSYHTPLPTIGCILTHHGATHAIAVMYSEDASPIYLVFDSHGAGHINENSKAFIMTTKDKSVAVQYLSALTPYPGMFQPAITLPVPAAQREAFMKGKKST